MPVSSRRVVAGLIRLGLVVLALIIVGGYLNRRFSRRRSVGTVRVERQAPVAEALAPGDIRIYNADSTVDLVLSGNRILAGLSPQTVAKIKGAIDSSAARDTGGIGGAIGQIVKQSVAGALGTHIAYPLSGVRDVRYEGGQIVIVSTDGKSHPVFGNTKVDGQEVSSSFRADDAERFIDAVRARMGRPPAR